MTGTTERSRWYAIGLLTVVCFGATLVNRPGSYFADARFEYAFEPERGIRQLGALWQSTGGLGRIAGTEQGPIPILTYWLLRSIGFGPELAQHLWHGLLLTVAAIGAASVVARFRPRWGVWHITAGILYAFNPLSLGLFTNSLLFLASIVVAPWMHLAVLNAGRGEQRWKWAAVLALCIAASLPTELPGPLFNLMFLVPTAFYVVCVERSCTPVTMAKFLARATVLTMLSVSFVIVRTIHSLGDLVSRLTLSEDPAIVSTSTSYSESLRGMGSWLAYFRFGSLVARPQFAPLIESPLVVAATFAIPIGATVFLIRSDWRPRFLFAALAPLSLVVVVGLYPFPLTPWGEFVGWLNDAVPSTAAFRNSLKAGAPMVLSLAVLFGGLVARMVRKRPASVKVLVGLSIAAIFAASSIPVWSLELYPSNRRVESVPAYWYEAADWLNDQGSDGTGRVLVLPGSTATTYRWGYVGDDIFTALLTVPYLRQGAFPASTAEANSVLAALDRTVGDPRVPVTAQLDVLRRFGVRFVLIRNDLAWQSSGRPRPALFDPWRQNPELSRVATFGQLGEFTTDGSDDTSDASSERFLPPVEIYELDDWQPIVRAVPDAAPLLMSGDGAGWISLATNGLLKGSRPVVSTASLLTDELVDLLDRGSALFVTDSNTLRQLSATSSTLSATSVLQSGASGRGVYSLYPGEEKQTTSWISGVKAVRSSVANLSRPWFRAENAFDGDTRTSWRSGPVSPGREPWLEIEFTDPRRIQQLEVQVEEAEDFQIATGEVILTGGERYPFSLGPEPTVVELDGELTESVRVVMTGVVGDDEVAIASIAVDDHDLAERRQVPHDVAVAAATNPDVARAIQNTDVSYVFTREIGGGERPIELVLRRRFSNPRAFDARLTGTLQLNDAALTPNSPQRCGDRVVQLDGRDVPIRVEPVAGSVDELTFSSCAPVRLELGWHDLGHGEDIAIDQMLVLPEDLRADEFELPWPAHIGSTPQRMSGVDAFVSTTASGAALPVISGRAAHSGWEAHTADGERLEAITLDAQAAFAQKSESSARSISIRFKPQRSYDALMAAMYLGLGLCVFLALRRTTPDRIGVFGRSLVVSRAANRDRGHPDDEISRHG